jgi:hypothetical protein
MITALGAGNRVELGLVQSPPWTRVFVGSNPIALMLRPRAGIGNTGEA